MTTGGARMSEPMSVPIDIRDVPRELVEAVDRDAQALNVSISDRISAILCERYGLTHEPTGYRYTAGGASDHWNIRVPERVRATLLGHAIAIGGTTTGCVLLAVSAHYGLPPISPLRRVEPILTGDEIRSAREKHTAGASLRALATEFGVTRKALTRAIRET